MKPTTCSSLLASGLFLTLLVGSARAQVALPHPSTSSPPLKKGQVVVVTDLDLGAADSNGKVGQEIVIVSPIGFNRASQVQVIGPDGSLRFYVETPEFPCTQLSCP